MEAGLNIENLIDREEYPNAAQEEVEVKTGF
jgi:hypothetical protein